MDQEKAGSKIVLWRKPLKPDDSGAWTRLSKALKSFAELEEIESESPISEPQVAEAINQGKKVFLELSLADVDALAKNPKKGLILVRQDGFAWQNPQAREALLPVLLRHSCLTLDGISATDLLRVLHLYLVPKNQAGVCALMEKNSLVIAEKVQSLDSIGGLLDRFTSYLKQMEGLELKHRTEDFRQVITALLIEAYQRSSDSNPAYPTVEFQVSAQSKKIAVNFRFPLGNLDATILPEQVLNGTNLRWHSLWQCSDLLMVTHHEQHKQVEVHALFLAGGKGGSTRFTSFLFRTLDRSAQSESALVVPKDYRFSVFSEIKVLKSAVADSGLAVSDDVVSEGIDLSSLPEAVSKQITQLEQDRKVLKDFAEKKERESKENAAKFAELKKELAQRRGEVLKLQKAQENSNEAFQRKIAEYEKRIQNTQAQASSQNAAREEAAAAAPVANLQEAITKLEAGLRAAEQEKNSISDRLHQEQKRVSMYEQKYAQLFKDISAKDKEIQDLKQIMLKFRKEHGIDDARPGAAGSQQGESPAKMKEFEQREAAMKQELRKLQFKLDNHEKNLKAQQQEAAEKAKLMEQKLQTAKTRELELLKKIEDLSTALKKVAKAA